jgi:uncharacterized repeat protein (TIGR01451 family)
VGETGSITCTGTLASGETASFAIVVRVNSNVADGTIITNVSSFNGESSSDTVEVKTSATLIFSKSAPSQALASSPLIYTLQITNPGPSDAQNVIVTDTLPANVSFVSASNGGTFAGGQVIFNFGTIAAGATVTATITTNVNSDVRAGAVLSNTATITSDTPNSGDPSITAETIAQTVVAAVPSPTLAPVILFPAGGIPSPACGC